MNPHIEVQLAASIDGAVLAVNRSTVELEVLHADGTSVGLPPSARGLVPSGACVRTPPDRDYSKPAAVDEHELQRAQRIGMTAYRNAGVDFLWVTRLHDGRSLFLLPWHGAGVQLSVGHIGSAYFIETWDYDAAHRDDAWRAVLTWDGHGEPDGWTRHPASGRIRPDGTAASEQLEGRGQQ